MGFISLKGHSGYSEELKGGNRSGSKVSSSEPSAVTQGSIVGGSDQADGSGDGRETF